MVENWFLKWDQEPINHGELNKNYIPSMKTVNR